MLASPIFACALGDYLRRRAADGDAKAIAILVQLAPQNVPPAAVRAWRDAEIRRAADWLAAAVPGITVHRAATMLSRAGEIRAQGRRLGAEAAFAVLDRAERDILGREVERIRCLAPPWPRIRQMITIISECSEFAERGS